MVAAAVRLIDKAHIRVGNKRYAETNGSHGATTLTTEHVELADVSISLGYPGKSGRQIEVQLSDEKLAAVLRECEEIDGQYLFSYLGESDALQTVTSSDINDYLQKICGEYLTAKDFRTWWGSVLALRHLQVEHEENPERSPARAINAAVSKTADEMSHTKAVCRSSYVHPGLIAALENGTLLKLLKNAEKRDLATAELVGDERMFLAILPKLDVHLAR